MTSRLVNRDFLATPRELLYRFPSNDQGVILSKKTLRTWPDNGVGQTYRQNHTINFTLGGGRVIDLSSVRFVYSVTIKDSTDSNNEVADGDNASNPEKPGLQIQSSNQDGTAMTFDQANPALTKTSHAFTDFTTHPLRSSEFDRPFTAFEQELSDDATAARKANSVLYWIADHGSSVIRTSTTLLNNATQVERVTPVNRTRSFLAKHTVSENYKNTLGSYEGYIQRGSRPGLDHISETIHTVGKGLARQYGYSERLSDDAKKSFFMPDAKYHIANGMSSREDRVAYLNHALTTAPALWVTKPNAALNEHQKLFQSDYGFIEPTHVDSNKRQVSIPIDWSGFFSLNKYLSTHVVGSINLNLELESNDVVIDLATKLKDASLGAPTRRNHLSYEISDAFLEFDAYEVSSAYLESMNKALFGPGINIFHDTMQVIPHSIQHTNQTLQITKTLSNLKTVWVYFQHKALINGSRTDATEDALNKTSTFPRYGLESYNFLIDNVPVNSNVVSTKWGQEAEAMHELAKSFRVDGEHLLDTAFSKSNYHQSAFGIGLDLEKSNLQSGTTMQRLQLDLRFQAGLPFSDAGLIAFVVLHYDQRIVVRPGFDFVVIN